MPVELKTLLSRALPRSLLLDLEDRMRAEASRAHTMISEHARLNRKRSRELEGQARFRMWEEGFEEVCQDHGGTRLDEDVIPTTGKQVYQPFMRFDVDGTGVILGLASMPEPKKVPAKNISRKNAAGLNYNLSPRLDFDGTGARIGDIFVLLLVARDREVSGLIEEIAVGVIDSGCTSFLFYQPLEQFLALAADMPDMSQPVEVGKPKVTLKREVKPFVPPEQVEERGESSGST